MLFDQERKLPSVRYEKNRLRKHILGYRFQDFAFSGLNPGYNLILRKEIFNLRTIVGFTMEEIMNMPVQERRYYTILHNERVEQQNEEMKGNAPMHDIGAVQKMTDQANSIRESQTS
jgi:hypothetical protein